MDNKKGNIIEVAYRDDNGIDIEYVVGRNLVKEIFIYRAQGEGDKGYVAVWFEDGRCIELYKFDRVYFDKTKAVK